MTQSGKSYREIVGLAPSTAALNDSVLIIIDAQNEYVVGELLITNLATSRPAIAALVERYRASGNPVIHILHKVAEGYPAFTPGTTLAEEFDELRPVAGEVTIEKIHPGAFTQTTLKQELDKLGRNKIVLVGYMAHACVSTTAREGSQEGYDVFVVEDAIGARDIPGATADVVVKVVCAELADVFGTVIKSGDII
ncbi:putative isochorismatase family protein [Mycena indigotica]|uniref:Putative isochorismatase family protein n=1 Tax=Mycena indigotica TaxID=2126181 RepID=A0A8H6TCG2_9AGAR|nr:putative isochorismatase family protein [Mycena indigotica]KAF7314901.1 putative isochorismatase family protein [Mycena indigotica]